MHKQGTSFTKTRLAASLSIALGISSFAPVSMAQEDNSGEVEVINVTGVRGSLMRSMDVKRSSEGIVDAISAEDMGKFPDTNLAESLQRITGVSIDRSNGEGSKVTVRGWGPEQNLVTFNGRQLPNTTGDRSFDFANIASEGVSGVEVYKTGDAAVATGGVGSVINVLTNRPLNNAGTVASVSIKGVKDTSTDKGSITPELSGIYSMKSDDGKFGVSIVASYQQRDSGNQQGNVGTGWRSFDGDVDGDWSDGEAAWGGVQGTPQVNGPESGDIYSVPQTTTYTFEETQRTRANGQLVLQYAPTDSLVATLDYTYISNEVDTQHQNISAWYNFGPSENVWTDGPVKAPLLYSDFSGTDLSMGAGSAATKATTDSIGLNIEWQATDDLKITLDHHTSDGGWGANGPYGTAPSLSLAAFVRTDTATDFTKDLPALSVGGGNDVEWSDIRLTGSVFGNGKNTQEINQTQLDFQYGLNDTMSLDFGVARNEVFNRVQNTNVQRDDWGGVGEEGDFEEEWFDKQRIHDKFDVPTGDFSIADEVIAAGSEKTVFDLLDTMFFWDFESVVARADELYADSSAVLGDCGSSFCPSTDWAGNEDRSTTETSTSAYAKFNYETDIGDMYLRANVGMRYEKTKVESSSSVLTYNSSAWVADNEVVLSETEQVFLEREGDYDYWLPSLNLTLDVTDDVVVRAAASKTIARAGYGNLISGVDYGSPVLPTDPAGSAGSGNPSLLPLESVNFDVSVEWYFDDASYASIGYFTKKVSNFIADTTSENLLDTAFNPGTGLRADAARAALVSEGLDTSNANIRSKIFELFPDDPFVDVANGIIYGNPSEDDAVVYTLNQPGNGTEERTVDGVELAVQHFFGDSGFGVIANYTYVTSDLEYDNFILTDQEALLGLSDTANLVGMYEKDGVSVRLAYNWRDKFLSSRGDGTGSNPTYTEAYNQFDVNASYDIPSVEGLTVFIEALNITDEYTRTHGRATSQVLNLTQTGARYNFGARYKF